MLFTNKLKVAIAVSGGVDSTVSAILLKQNHFDLIGVYMNNWSDYDGNGVCESDTDREHAKSVCRSLDIPFKEISFEQSYWNNVFTYLLDSYQTGETPNPDIMCNRFVKFGSFLDYALKCLNCDAIATGHYAKSSYGQFWHNYDPQSRVKLFRAKDLNKDQTFFLSQLSQTALKKAMFPLENLLKSEVRQIAKQFGFEYIAKKPESDGICFIGKRNFKSFISEYIEPKRGDFIDIETNIKVGEHNGIHLWTIGENCKLCLKNKYFVVKKDVKTNSIYVAPHTNHLSLYGNTMITKIPHWICEEPKQLTSGASLRCLFKFQQIDKVEECYVYKLKNNQLLIELTQPKRALTAGQFVVLYIHDECIGSAAIDEHWFHDNQNSESQLKDEITVKEAAEKH